MRDNRRDQTLQRNYIQKYRFLMREYERVKKHQHPQFRLVQDFYTFHGTTRQTFAKYYQRYRQGGGDASVNGGGMLGHWGVEVQGKCPDKCSAEMSLG